MALANATTNKKQDSGRILASYHTPSYLRTIDVKLGLPSVSCLPNHTLNNPFVLSSGAILPAKSTFYKLLNVLCPDNKYQLQNSIAFEVTNSQALFATV